MRTAKSWVDEHTQCGAFDCVMDIKHAEEIVREIQEDAIRSFLAEKYRTPMIVKKKDAGGSYDPCVYYKDPFNIKSYIIDNSPDLVMTAPFSFMDCECLTALRIKDLVEALGTVLDNNQLCLVNELIVSAANCTDTIDKGKKMAGFLTELLKVKIKIEFSMLNGWKIIVYE